MKEVGAFEATNRLGTLLDWVEQGEEVVISWRGKAIAKLVPNRPRVDREEARAAAQAIRAMSKGVNLAGVKLKDLINEGRL
ncbi:MAG TPA: type II toxin-antitoxin system prevent-host-death family antitoxin [Acetobacteraceae bacterium]